MVTKQLVTRRRFIKSAVSAAATITIVPRRVLGGAGFTPPSEQLTKAVIGTGVMGKTHLDLGDTRLLAVCDVDERHLQAALDIAGPRVKGYRDFREVLARPDIDIVHIVTPPHWHGLISIAAAQAGKDILCEKPMTRTIGEGRKVVEAVQRNGRIFRVNTWFRFRRDFYGLGTPTRLLKKLVDSRLLGWPLKVTVSSATGFRLGGWVGRTNLKPEPVPPHLDYNMWLGPAPYKPFNAHRVHTLPGYSGGVGFRGYWDYDGGTLADMGQHYLDPVQYFLGKDDTSPIEIEVDTPQQHPDAVRPWRRIWLKYADGCEIVLEWENIGEKAPYIEGPRGKLYKGFLSDIPNLRKKLAAFPDPPPQLTDFSRAVRTRQKFALNEENGHRSCTLVNLGKIALRVGRPLHFDPDQQRFIGDEQANRLIDQPMRGPWHL